MLVVSLLAALLMGALWPASAVGMTRGEAKLLRAMNSTRTAHGLHRLKSGDRLHQAARSWAGHLRRHDAFYHRSLPSGQSENMGWLTCRPHWAKSLVRMWLESPTHRVHLLDRDARAVGVGVSKGHYLGYSCVRLAVTDFR
jgi:uncharacterized protein YkwD